MKTLMLTSLTVFLAGPAWVHADAKSKAAAEVAEFLLRKSGKEAIKDGTETFTKRLAQSASKHGDDVFAAVKRVGPHGLQAIEEAGEHGGKLARLMGSHGDDAVVWVAKRPRGLAILAKHGDDAGAAICKHKGIAEPLIDKLGEPAVKALTNVGAQSGRRLAIMAESGDLAKIGRSEQLLGVIGKFGDKAASFVWENKGALGVSATLTAFLANPEPFIDGTVKLAEPIAELPGKMVESIAAPLAQAPANAITSMADQAAKRTDWTIIIAILSLGGLALLGLRMLNQSRQRAAEAPQ